MTDPFPDVRRRFYLPDGVIYLDGNSLGLLSRDAEQAVLRALEQWKQLGVRGWLEAEPPWYTFCESLAARVAPLVGAAPANVAVTGSTTMNLHQLVASLYKPAYCRTRILADATNFPTDLYALAAQLRLHGRDADDELVLVHPRDGGLLEEHDLVEAMDGTVALALFSLVQYKSGQLLDAPRVTRAARERGIVIGWDLSHSIGVVPHDLDGWDADFAIWCHYKYLNAGPGAVGGLYVNERHHDIAPALAGWWGSRKERQFAMDQRFTPASGAGAFQVSTPSILGVAALSGSLELVETLGIGAIRERSCELTSGLISALDARLPRDGGFWIGTPRDPRRRGGHVALQHPTRAVGLNGALKARGVIPDFRPPDVIRLCPSPLYVEPGDVDRAVEILAEIVETRADGEFPEGPDLVA
jgi:kynureninase